MEKDKKSKESHTYQTMLEEVGEINTVLVYDLTLQITTVSRSDALNPSLPCRISTLFAALDDYLLCWDETRKCSLVKPTVIHFKPLECQKGVTGFAGPSLPLYVQPH